MASIGDTVQITFDNGATWESGVCRRIEAAGDYPRLRVRTLMDSSALDATYPCVRFVDDPEREAFEPAWRGPA